MLVGTCGCNGTLSFILVYRMHPCSTQVVYRDRLRTGTAVSCPVGYPWDDIPADGRSAWDDAGVGVAQHIAISCNESDMELSTNGGTY